MTNNDNLTCFRDASIKQSLLTRGNSSGDIARRDIDRYYVLLADALRRVKLTSNEAMLLCDALNGTLNEFRINPAQALVFSVQDAIDLDSLDSKWEVDKTSFLAKLKGLNTLEAAAVLDAVERFWYEPEYQIEDTKVKLAQVGLI